MESIIPGYGPDDPNILENMVSSILRDTRRAVEYRVEIPVNNAKYYLVHTIPNQNDEAAS